MAAKDKDKDKDKDKVAKSETLGTPFGFDAAKFLKERQPGVPLVFDDPTPESSLLREAMRVTESLTKGELPIDVQRQVERTSAYASISRGLNGPISRALTARDLGRTSLDLMSTGLQVAPSLLEADDRRRAADREWKLRIAGFNEDIRKANDDFSLKMKESDIGAAQVSLSALEIQSRNRQALIAASNDLIITNAQYEVGGIDAHLAGLSGAFNSINRDIQQISNVFTDL